MHLGATAYLVKPFKPEDLVKKVHDVLAPDANVAPQMVQPPAKK